ncbi:ATP F0F1 synthase subunit B [Consotaella aegiceratis]|uniref:F0F1 ATP synthase subunit B family protein n=1 Tax=Consotaella aegiceratis TaxID=3097961 RepID=UPI002F3FDB45
MFAEAAFWATVGLLVLVGVAVYFKAPAMMIRSLDARADQIRNEIEEARELKEEAKQQLAEFQRRRREAEDEAKEIVASAKREADAIVEEARVKSADYIARRTTMAEMKISQAEADAVADVRSSAVDIAIAAAAKLIAERNGAAKDDRFFEQSIAEVRKRLQ